MCKLDYKESWVPENWCFWTVVLEKTPESPLDCKEIQLVHPKGNQSWIFIGRTDAETPILWPSDVKKWLIGKDPDTGKDWRWEKKGLQRMRWLDDINHAVMTWVWVNSGVGDGQGGLECCTPLGCKKSDTTEQLIWTEPRAYICFHI